MNPYSIMVGDLAIATEPHVDTDAVTGDTYHVAIGDRGVVDHVEYSEPDPEDPDDYQQVYVGVSYGPVWVSYVLDHDNRPRFPERGDGWLLRCSNLGCPSRRAEAPSFGVHAECGADGVLSPIEKPAHHYTCQHCGAAAEEA